MTYTEGTLFANGGGCFGIDFGFIDEIPMGFRVLIFDEDAKLYMMTSWEIADDHGSYLLYECSPPGNFSCLGDFP